MTKKFKSPDEVRDWFYENEEELDLWFTASNDETGEAAQLQMQLISSYQDYIGDSCLLAVAEDLRLSLAYLQDEYKLVTEPDCPHCGRGKTFTSLEVR